MNWAPRWWSFLRETVIFALGVAVMLDALLNKDTSLGELIVGLVMIGILPIDRLVALIDRRRPGP